MKSKMIFGMFFVLFTSVLMAFELPARVYPAGREVTLKIKAVSKWGKEWVAQALELQKAGKDTFKKGNQTPLLGYFREDRRYSDGDKYMSTGHPEPLSFKLDGDVITVTLTLRGEHIHSLCFTNLAKPRGKRANNRALKLLSLEGDNFKLRPFKGNVHQHSTFSDGRFKPEEHVGYARIAGFDYVGVSDHFNYAQNEIVIKAAADCKSGLTVYPAEEMHTAGAILHSLSIGGTKQHSYKGKRTPEWMETIKPVYDELAKAFPNQSREQLIPWAESLALARRAKEDGALVVYCHPTWKRAFFLHNTTEMMDFIIRSKEFHAIEVINGGIGHLGNSEAIARFHELCIELGMRIPVLSTSDSHNVSSLKYRDNYSVFFATDSTFPSFKAAVIEGRTVAVVDVYDIDKKAWPMSFGPFKYVQFANFLHSSGYWKKHDEIAKKQGELILKYMKGDQALLPEIAKLAEEIVRYREGFFYKP